MASVLQYLPDVDGEEMVYLNTLLTPMSDTHAQRFSMLYRARRKDPTMILVFAILGLLPIIGVPIAGIHRFILGQAGMGLLYLFTLGACGIGTIVDIVNYKKMTSEYNLRQAYDVAMLMQTFTQGQES